MFLFSVKNQLELFGESGFCWNGYGIQHLGPCGHFLYTERKIRNAHLDRPDALERGRESERAVSEKNRANALLTILAAAKKRKYSRSETAAAFPFSTHQPPQEKRVLPISDHTAHHTRSPAVAKHLTEEQVVRRTVSFRGERTGSRSFLRLVRIEREKVSFGGVSFPGFSVDCFGNRKQQSVAAVDGAQIRKRSNSASRSRGSSEL